MDWLYLCVKRVFKALHQANPIAKSILHTMELIHKAQIQVAPSEFSSLPAPVLAMSNVLKQLQSFYEALKEPEAQREANLDKVNQVASHLVTEMQAVMSMLSNYPLSCPTQVLQQWETCFCSILEMAERASSKEMIKELNTSVEQLIVLRELNEAIELIKVSRDLKMYSSLRTAEGKHQCEKLIQCALLVNEVYASSPCLSTLSHWVYPSMTIQTPLRLRVHLERLHPPHKVFVCSQEHKGDFKIDFETMVMCPNGDQWELYKMASQGSCIECYNVCDDLVTSILGGDIRETLEATGSIQTSPEEAEQLLVKLNFEVKENKLWFEAKLCDQVLVEESEVDTCAVIVVSLRSACIATYSGFDELRGVKLSSEYDDCVVVAYFECTPTALEALKEKEAV